MEERHSNREPERKDAPNASGPIGDDKNVYLGKTLPSDSVVFFDPALPLRQDGSCLIVVGEPGGRGKGDSERTSGGTREDEPPAGNGSD